MVLMAGDLRCFYPKHDGSADGQALTLLEVEAGSSAGQIVCDDLDGSANGLFDDYVLIGKSGTNLADVITHVKTWTDAGNTLNLATNLAGTPETGGTFVLTGVGAGKYRSSETITGLRVTADLSNITNSEISYVNAMCGIGNGTVAYDQVADTMTFQAPDDDNPGASVDVSGGANTYTLYSEDEDKCIDVTVSGALPGANASDTVTFARYEGHVLPNTEGYQSANGLIRHVGIFLHNTNAADAAHETAVWVEPRVDASSTLSANTGQYSNSFELANGSAFPARSFWLHNDTKNDCRYIKTRSGNTFNPMPANTYAVAAFDAGDTEVEVGDTVEGLSSGNNGVVMAIGVSSGSWGDGNAVGIMILKDVTGVFTNDEALQVSAANTCVANGASVLGLRGHTAQDWEAGDTIRCMPDADVAKATLSSDMLPSDFVTLTYGHPYSAATGTDFGEVAASSNADGVVLREWIMDDNYPVDDVISKLRGRAW